MEESLSMEESHSIESNFARLLHNYSLKCAAFRERGSGAGASVAARRHEFFPPGAWRPATVSETLL